MNGILMLCDDLIFSSKVAATGRAHGIPVVVARSPAALLKKAVSKPACVILDLHAEGLDIPTVVAELKNDSSPRILGFGSHVDAALLKAAREAGCDLVMPRSQFHKLLESDLPVWVQH